MSITDDKLLQTISALNRIYTAMELAQFTINDVNEVGQRDAGFEKKLEALDSKIKKSLNDDFNSAEMISFIFEGVRAFNALGFVNKKKKKVVHKGASEAFLVWMKKFTRYKIVYCINSRGL